ncbi:hypothetical protein ADK53_17860 [Streptomyces sp. WM6373]|nr:hypothetical protein ADK53_17860 [Streptomyces sp. WM6373]
MDKAQEMMVRLCLAFDLDLAQARCATECVELGLGGNISDGRLKAADESPARTHRRRSPTPR